MMSGMVITRDISLIAEWTIAELKTTGLRRLNNAGIPMVKAQRVDGGCS